MKKEKPQFTSEDNYTLEYILNVLDTWESNDSAGSTIFDKTKKCDKVRDLIPLLLYRLGELIIPE